MSHGFSSSLMHNRLLPSEPLHVTSTRAARQASRAGEASTDSKLVGQVQTAEGGSVAASVGPALVRILPPHAVSQARARSGTDRTKGMLERLRDAEDDGLAPRPRCRALMRRPIQVIRTFPAPREGTRPARTISRAAENA